MNNRDLALKQTVLVLQEKNLAGVAVEYVAHPGGPKCLHYHTAEQCYYFEADADQVGYLTNDRAHYPEYPYGERGYATDVSSDGATPEEIADWVIAVATTGAPFEYAGRMITDPTWDEGRQNRVNWRTYWGDR